MAAQAPLASAASKTSQRAKGRTAAQDSRLRRSSYARGVSPSKTEFVLSPVARVRGGRAEPTDDGWDAETCVLELDDRFDPSSLAGLDEFSHLEVVYVFDRVAEATSETRARHPRERADWPLVGIFAQRGKSRPNRLGVSRCRLLRVDGTKLHVAGLDAIDGTPVVDIKPYMREFGPRGSVAQPTWATELMSGYYQPPGAAARDVTGASGVTAAFARDMALYSRWQNRGLYELCEKLGDDARRLDRGMFFGSIHNTLNHMLVLDRALLVIVRDGTWVPIDHRAVPYADFAELRAERALFDDGLVALAGDRGDAWFGANLTFFSQRLGRERTLPRALLFAQMINHATHHRSQVTSELFKLGVDYGVTDMPFNPDLPY
jgi:tRNA-Thr(GGU) m(6)t(6)A37 methyltransferase TsaA